MVRGILEVYDIISYYTMPYYTIPYSVIPCQVAHLKISGHPRGAAGALHAHPLRLSRRLAPMFQTRRIHCPMSHDRET